MTRVLFGYSDTEGTPHVQNNDSELWNMATIFKHIITDVQANVEANVQANVQANVEAKVEAKVQAKVEEKNEEVFHVTHLSINKNANKKDVTQSLALHFSSIEFLRKFYECDRVCLAFWGAPHDMAVLNSYNHGYEFESLDLLSIARELNPDIDSFNIGKLCKRFGVECKTSKVHTGLGDVLRMIDLLPKLNMNSPTRLYNLKAFTLNNEKKTRSNIRRHNPKIHQKTIGRSTVAAAADRIDIAALAIQLVKTKI